MHTPLHTHSLCPSLCMRFFLQVRHIRRSHMGHTRAWLGFDVLPQYEHACFLLHINFIIVCVGDYQPRCRW